MVSECEHKFVIANVVKSGYTHLNNNIYVVCEKCGRYKIAEKLEI